VRPVRVDVDPVDLAAEEEVVAEVEPTLQLGRRAVGAEADLEAAREQLQRRLRLVADEALEIAPQALLQLGRLQLGQLEPHATAQRVVETAPEEADGLLEVLRRHAVVADLLREARVELVQRAVRDGAAQHRVRFRIDRLRRHDPLE
jgi:hypothetical protein